MRVATLPNHPVRAAARNGAMRALRTPPGRAAAARAARTLLTHRTGRRATR